MLLLIFVTDGIYSEVTCCESDENGNRTVAQQQSWQIGTEFQRNPYKISALFVSSLKFKKF